VLWYANDGAGSFSAGMLVLGTATGVRTVDLGDLDRDGDLDIALARSNATQIEWMENEGGTPPGFTLRSPPDAFPAPFAVRVADFDGDGRNDLLATSLTNDRVAWFRNLGGRPAAFVLASVRSNVPDATNLETSDLDGDGDEEFLVAATLADRVFWFENLGPATFPRARVLPPDVDGVLGAVAADLDGDGTVDLAVANAVANTVARLPNRPALFWDDFEVGSTAVWAGHSPP
jgi:FG-GAP-like repeat